MSEGLGYVFGRRFPVKDRRIQELSFQRAIQSYPIGRGSFTWPTGVHWGKAHGVRAVEGTCRKPGPLRGAVCNSFEPKKPTLHLKSLKKHRCGSWFLSEAPLARNPLGSCINVPLKCPIKEAQSQRDKFVAFHVACFCFPSDGLHLPPNQFVRGVMQYWLCKSHGR